MPLRASAGVKPAAVETRAAVVKSEPVTRAAPASFRCFIVAGKGLSPGMMLRNRERERVAVGLRKSDMATL